MTVNTASSQSYFSYIEEIMYTVKQKAFYKTWKLNFVKIKVENFIIFHLFYSDYTFTIK